MLSEELKKKIENIPVVKSNLGYKLGTCQRCHDYGRLYKVPWEDPYEGKEGLGWLCGECVEKSQSVHRLAKQFSIHPGAKTGTSGFHPVPKPTKKSKDKKT